MRGGRWVWFPEESEEKEESRKKHKFSFLLAMILVVL